ncbi:MAG: hypothetical protein MJ174_07495 [Treponema sp.]|nr:hypothetical protein [Treponema sp.]
MSYQDLMKAKKYINTKEFQDFYKDNKNTIADCFKKAFMAGYEAGKKEMKLFTNKE